MAHWTDTFFTGFWGIVQRSSPLTEGAVEEAAVIRKLLRLRAGSTVADIPCGDGRISLELARAGCAVTGVDACEASVRRARRRFAGVGLAGEFHVGDMRGLNLPAGAFDAVVNWWGSFGYFDDETNLAVLTGLADLVRPGGRVLIDQVNRERILRDFMSRGESTYGPVRVVTRNRWDARLERVDGRWTFTRDGAKLTRRSSIRLYTPKQMTALMRRAGLRVERFFDGATGEPFDRGSRRMTTVGRKPG